MKKKRWIIAVIAVCLVIGAVFLLLGDDEDTEVTRQTAGGETTQQASGQNTTDLEEESRAGTADEADAVDTDETWAIYWYLCGSDLESDGGAATADIQEMIDCTKLPENVQIIIETGGAYSWQNSTIDPNYLERYRFSADGWEFLEQQPSSSMGAAETLQDFLTFCQNGYDADRKMVVFWNHGGGSVSGVAFDEIYDGDSLTLDEIAQAFAASSPVDAANPPYELVGFDACLMATIETAKSLQNVSRYMVASEETEPGNGWYYTGWLDALAKDPTMNGAGLGKEICDSYMTGCEMYGTQDEATLSVIDLQAAADLFTAYDNLGVEALQSAYDNPVFFTDFARDAAKAVNYGGNTQSAGYTNMIDLGDLVEKSQSILPENSQAVLDALDRCVVYKVNGAYRADATGLSCYYSFDGDTDVFDAYTNIASSVPFSYFYQYELYGQLGEGGYNYLTDGQSSQTAAAVPTFADYAGTDLPLNIDDDGNAVLQVSQDMLNALSSITFDMAYVDQEEDLIIYLGSDNDIQCDWQSGTFKDNFRGVWGALDDHLVYMELTEEGSDYNIYTVPILLNQEEYNLRVHYDYNTDTYQILGARKAIDEESGMADKKLVLLKSGDTITTRAYASTITGDDEAELYDVDTFTVTQDTTFEEIDMGDGQFLVMFELTDTQNTTLTTEPVWFTVEGDSIYTSLDIM